MITIYPVPNIDYTIIAHQNPNIQYVMKLLRTTRSTLLKPRLAARRVIAKYVDPAYIEAKKNNPALCVIAGMQHSGTTLASQLLNGHPQIAAGVECGLLLSNIYDFESYKHFYRLLTNKNWGWAITPEDREKLLSARSYDEAYVMLGKFKGKAHEDPDLKRIFANSKYIYDKTPQYVFDLDKIIKKIDLPFIVTIKKPLEIIDSYKKRSIEFKIIMKSYSRALEQTVKASRKNPDKILIVKYQTLASKPTKTMHRIQNFIGLNDGLDLTLERYNKRFGRLIKSGKNFRNDRVRYKEPTPVLDHAESSAVAAMEGKYAPFFKYIEAHAI